MNIMLNLDKRCQEILKRLMYAGGYLKIQDLADEMQISRRSVYYDITKINEWLEDQEIDPLVQERGKGIFVSSEQSRRIQEAMSDQGVITIMSLPRMSETGLRYVQSLSVPIRCI